MPILLPRQSRAQTCLTNVSGDKQTDPLNAIKDASVTPGLGGTPWLETRSSVVFTFPGVTT